MIAHPSEPRSWTTPRHGPRSTCVTVTRTARSSHFRPFLVRGHVTPTHRAAAPQTRPVLDATHHGAQHSLVRCRSKLVAVSGRSSRISGGEPRGPVHSGCTV